MYRSLLNGSEIIQFESSYVEDIENFIRLNGVIVNYNYIIIDTDCSDWKTLLENLMVINTINVKNFQIYTQLKGRHLNSIIKWKKYLNLDYV